MRSAIAFISELSPYQLDLNSQLSNIVIPNCINCIDCNRVYARWSILTFFKNKASVPIFWLKGHVISGFRPFLGSLMKNWLSAPGLSVHTRFRHIADPRKSIKSNISRTTGRIKLADPSFEAECPWIYCKFSYLKPMNRLSCP